MTGQPIRDRLALVAALLGPFLVARVLVPGSVGPASTGVRPMGGCFGRPTESCRRRRGAVWTSS